MASENPVVFTLHDDTRVIVKKITDSKYDFELILLNGNRKTFVWEPDTSIEFLNRKGYSDALLCEAVHKFEDIMNKAS